MSETEWKMIPGYPRYEMNISTLQVRVHITDGIFKGPNDGGQWDTYEEALEAGIQKAIELI